MRRGESRQFHIVVRIEATITLRETGDACGLEATIETDTEALVTPEPGGESVEHMVRRVLATAYGSDVALALTGEQLSPAVRHRFGLHGGANNGR